MMEKEKPDLGRDDEDVPIRVEDRRFWARRDAGEDLEEAEPSTRHPAYVEELEGRLREAEARRDEILAAHRRVQQEFEESRTRLRRDVETRVLQAKASAFRRLLEIADHMDLALQSTGREGAAKDPAALAEGVRLIHAQLLSALRDEGVERIDVVGQPFDPEVAEAVAVLDVDDPAEHDAVVREVRPGYRLGELTIRPAQVLVGRCVATRRVKTEGNGPEP